MWGALIATSLAGWLHKLTALPDPGGGLESSETRALRTPVRTTQPPAGGAETLEEQLRRKVSGRSSRRMIWPATASSRLMKSWTSSSRILMRRAVPT